MSARRLLILCCAALASAGFAAAALAADRTTTLTEATPEAAWTGPRTTGHAAVFYGYVGGPCTKQPVNYCDETLLHVTLPEGAERGSFSVGIAGDGDDDFDLFLYSSDSEGTTGDMLKYSTNPGTGGETVGLNITSSGWYLAKVHYFDVDDSAYSAQAKLFLPGSTQIEVTPTPTPTSTATATPTPEPESEPPAPAPGPASPEPAAAAPAPAAASAAPALPELTRAKVRRRTAIGRLRCETACVARVAARARGRRLGRTSVRVAEGDTVEFRVPLARRARRGVVLRVDVVERSGRRTTLTLPAA